MISSPFNLLFTLPKALLSLGVYLFDHILIVARFTAGYFAAIWSAIVISLKWTTIKDSVLLVINLSFLSLLVIGLWIYATDMLFIFLVYVLAFVGAVIMLFISVILMLPSTSSVYSSSLNRLILIVAVTPMHIDNGLTSFGLLTLVVSLILLLFLNSEGQISSYDSIRQMAFAFIAMAINSINNFIFSNKNRYLQSLTFDFTELFRYGEVLMQNSNKFSLFFAACPNITAVTFYTIGGIILYFDGLVSLKDTLFINGPLLWLVSVLTLLVALIGSSVFFRMIKRLLGKDENAGVTSEK